MKKYLSIAFGISFVLTAPISTFIIPEINGFLAFCLGLVFGAIGAILILPHIFLKQQ